MFYNFVPVIMFSAFKLGVSCVRDLVSPKGLVKTFKTSGYERLACVTDENKPRYSIGL